MPNVRVLRPFANRHAEDVVHPGDEIEVDCDRARDLAGNGLVEGAPDERAAHVPANKIAPAPSVQKPKGRR